MIGNRTPHRVLGLLALAAAALLTGCTSGKPGASDIEHALLEAYGCPAVEFRDVKKLDGAPGPNGTYNVGFSYSVGFKGGEAAAIRFLTEWTHLRSERVVIADALRPLTAPGRNHAGTADTEQIAVLKAYETQVEARLNDVQKCSSPDISMLLDAAQQAIDAKTPTVALPVSAQVVKASSMNRTEQGWHLNQVVFNLVSFDLLTSKPAPFALPPSKVPGLLGATQVSTGTEGERTLVGVIRGGATDSCLAVTEGGAEKCYGLPGDAAQAQRIFSACKDGDSCSITGQFDAKSESLGAFSKVEKVAR